MPYCQVNGRAAHYREMGEAGRGETVLLLHAGATSSAHWRKVAPSLQGRFHLVAPDLIGFGETEAWGRACEPTHDDQAALAAGVAGHAASGPVHVVGHSFGGAVAVRLALRCPALIKSLVLIEPVLVPLLRQAGETALFEAERDLARAFIADAVASRSVSAWRRFMDHYNGDGTWEALSGNARYRFLSMTRETADAYRANLNNPTRLQDLRTIVRPTLLIWGARTTETYRRICQILSDHLPNASVLELAGAGHMSPLTHPDVIARAVGQHVEGPDAAARQRTGFETRDAA